MITRCHLSRYNKWPNEMRYDRKSVQVSESWFPLSPGRVEGTYWLWAALPLPLWSSEVIKTLFRRIVQLKTELGIIYKTSGRDHLGLGASLLTSSFTSNSFRWKNSKFFPLHWRMFMGDISEELTWGTPSNGGVENECFKLRSAQIIFLKSSEV